MKRHTVDLQKNSAKMVINFPILGRREQLWPHPPFQNTTTSDTSSVFLPKCWYPTERGLPGPSEPGQGDSVHTVQPLHFRGRPVPRGRATGSAQHPPASPSNPPTIHTELVPAAAKLAGLGLFCSHHKATRGCSARMACNPSAPSCHPWPTFTHPTAHSGSPRSPHGFCHTRWGLRPLLGGQAGQGGGASPDLPPMLPGKWSRPLPQGGMHLLGALSCPLQPQEGFPFVFGSMETSTVLPAQEREGGKGRRGRGLH